MVRAALAIWTARGFGTGIEETTIEEIVSAAGVTKGTFYFHFTRKEEILLEMGWESAAVANREAARCVSANRELDEALVRVIRALSRHIRAAPPGAVARAVAEFRRLTEAERAAFGREDFGDGLELLLVHAATVGQLPASADPVELAQILRALWMDSVLDWATGHSDLAVSLRRRSRLVIEGVHRTSA